ncbi:MAG: 6-carboxytetrahydropterin synthase QueD [Candidatus Omnitrophota bacterium]
MYSIKIEATFSAAHNLRGYKGKCEALHGHNWKIEAVVKQASLDKTGMVMDFRRLKKELKRVIERLDHRYLNRLKPFDRINPTSENLSRFIYEELKKKVSPLYSVTVWESERANASYMPDDDC